MSYCHNPFALIAVVLLGVCTGISGQSVTLQCLSGCSGCAPLETTFQINSNLPSGCEPYDVTVSNGSQTLTFNGVSGNQVFTVVNTATSTWAITSVIPASSCGEPFTIGPSVQVVVFNTPTFNDFSGQACTNSIFNLQNQNYTGQNTANCTFTFHSGLPPSASNQVGPSVIIPGDVTFYAVATNPQGCKDTFSIVVDALPLPNSGMGLISYLCQGNSGLPLITLTDLLIGEDPGGTWAVSNGSPNPGPNFDPVAGTLDPNGLQPALYILAYRASNPCGMSTTNTHIHILPYPNATATTTPAFCATASNGTMTVSAYGGDPPYQYDIGNGNTSNPVFNGLGPGSYTITVTDDSGCTNTVTGTVGLAPNQLNISCAQITPAFQGQNNGVGGVQIAGGTLGYTIAWTGPTTGSKTVLSPGLSPITGLAGGSYDVTVTDANGCTAECNFFLLDCSLHLSAQSTPVLCHGESTGAITLNVGNPSVPPEFTWSNSSWNGTQNPTDVAAGNYTVTVTAGAGCSSTASVSVPQPPLLTLNSFLTQVTCHNDNNGGIAITPSGGVVPYTFNWNPPQYNGQSVLTGLPAGNYSFVLTDNNGCTVAQAYTLPNPPPLQFGVDATPPACAGGTTGSIFPNASGGVPGYVYAWNPTQYSGMSELLNLGAGTYVLTLTDQNGCTEAITIALGDGANPDTTFATQTTCDPLQAGVETVTLTSSNGCDSVVTVTTLLAPSNATSLTASTCDPALAGVFTQTLQNQFGCDSIVTTTVAFDPSLLDTTYLSANTCDPQAAGEIANVFTGTNGCDSTVVTITSLLPSSSTALFGTTCNPTLTGVFTQTLQNQFGCDSVVTTTVTFDPSLLDTTYLSANTCDPQAIGVTANTLAGADGCDSTVVTTTSLLPSSSTALFGTTCNPTLTGVFTQILQNQFGCDSVVTTTVTFDPLLLDTIYLSASTCDPQAVGMVTSIFIGTDGCDSTVIITTSLLPSNSTALSGTTCNPAFAGVFIQILQNQFGCDSIVTTTVIYDPTVLDTTYLSATTCDPQAAGITSNTFIGIDGCDSTVVLTIILMLPNSTALSGATCDPALVGVFIQTLQNQFGCDSTVTTTVVYDPSLLDTTYLSATTCDPQAAGMAVSTFTGSDGCDSTVVLNTMLLPSGSTTLSGTTCNPALVGVFVQTLQNQFGCDSTVTTAVVYDPLLLDTTYLSASTCDPQATGTTFNTFTGSDGCDSTIVLNTTLLPTSSTALSGTTCNPAFAGIFIQTLQNQFGCDSVVTTTVIHDPTVLDTTYLSASTCDPLAAGTTFNTFTGIDGCDSTVVLTTMLLPSSSAAFFITTCNTALTGVFIQTLQNQFGCDSIVTTTITYDPSLLDTTYLSATTCDPQAAGVSANTLTGADGCDSTVITHLIFVSLTATAEVTQPYCYNINDGVIIIHNILNGTPPYFLSANGQPFIPATLPVQQTGLAPGTYTIFIQDSAGCAFADTFQLDDPPLADVDLGPGLEIALGDSVLLQPFLNFTPVSFNWQSNQPVCAQCLQQYVVPEADATYLFTAFYNAGCFVSGSVTIRVIEKKNIYTPNIINTSVSGFNNRFVIFADNSVEVIRQLNIYDRWGEMVFLRQNIQPNDYTQGWDGRCNGDFAQPGVYIWWAELELRNRKTKVVSGDVTLLR